MIVSLLLVCCVFSVDADEVKSVMEGDSLTLHTLLTDIKRGDVIRWRFGEEGSQNLIVEIVKDTITYNGKNGNFRDLIDRLQININTGDLTITNMRINHSGLYEAEISRTGTTYKRFRVNVTESPRVLGVGAADVKFMSVNEGDPVTLHTKVQTQRDYLILWRFGDEGLLIAKVNKEDDKSSTDDDERFRDRLELDQSGSLTITSFRITDSGLYHLKISRNNKQTLHKTFNVSVWDPCLSSGDVVGIVFGVLLAAVVGVILYRRINYEWHKRKVEEKRALENEFLILHTGVTKLQSDDEIQWSFIDEVIYRFKKNHKISNEEERLRDGLKVDEQTASLIITSIRTEDAGLYKVKMSSSSKGKLVLQFITSRGPSCSQFNVTVEGEAREEESAVHQLSEAEAAV